MLKAIEQAKPQPAQVSRISQIYTRAFFDDPLTRFIYPNPEDRHRLLRWYPIIVKYGLTYGEIHTTGSEETEGAAVWIPLDSYSLGIIRLIKCGFWLIPAIFGIKPLKKVIDTFNHYEATHKKYASLKHWYLFYIAVEPSQQGKGIGNTILTNMLKRIDDEHALCYLETTNPRNPAYYMKYGFETVGQSNIPNSGPICWSMLRKPQA